MEALQSTAPVGIGFVDREFHIVHMNELLAGLNGLSSDEAQGRSLPEVMGSSVEFDDLHGIPLMGLRRF